MKKICLILILMTWIDGFSQEIDSLSITYYIGHDCSYTIGSKTLRGGCERKEELIYSKRKNKYKISSFVSLETFREWKEGFRSNLIEDSIHTMRIVRNSKIQVKTLDSFLTKICSIRSHTIFPYKVENIPISFFEGHSEEEKNSKTKTEMDSILKIAILEVKVSSVVTRLSINFQYQGKHYSLTKSVGDVAWALYSENKEDWPLKFIYFDFDTFLLKNLPKKFSGIRIFN